MLPSQIVNTNCRYATMAELDYLRELAPTLTNVVMIGAGPGVMMVALREGNPKLHATVIDHDTCEYTQAHLAQHGLGESVVYILRDSAEVGRAWKEPTDLLIVDGDHSEAGVRADLAAWLAHVARGGYIFLHDYDANGTEFAGQERYPGVKVAVDEMLLPEFGYEVVRRVGTAIVFRYMEHSKSGA